MKERLLEECLKFRRFLFLCLFIMGILLIFNTTTLLLDAGKFNDIVGYSMATDRRTVYLLVTLFGFVGYFIDVILDRKDKGIK